MDVFAHPSILRRKRRRMEPQEIQYCASEYQQIHERAGIHCSMTDGYDCYQNSMAERVNGILRQEFLLHKPNNLEQARKMIAEFIKIYNSLRPHLALEYKTTDEVHQSSVNELQNRTQLVY